MVQHIHIVCMNITVSSDRDIGFVAMLQNFVEITTYLTSKRKIA